ncbi:Colicin-M immunity protein [Photorhabdus australis subsp. thailandensis]|uniref:Colicin-M immunity protein n=1 Tax=Photorhabdus australis subsp. thailandensis TaxID=2805096 RepID=A0A1C0U4J2_9GAMM|nr:protein YebF [Photorhabdus australis]OCQ52838.1 Colicin-M immunity protein [Photorhabdus australis subsp. thailandensis]
MKACHIINRVGLSSAALLFTISFTVFAVPESKRVDKFISCDNLTKSQIAAQVKRDFLQNRINRWLEDRKQLGTSTPVAWINVENITADKDVLGVPLTVRGSKRDKDYRVIVDCQQNTISYNELK